MLALFSSRAFFEQHNNAFSICRAFEFVPVALHKEWLPVQRLLKRNSGWSSFLKTRRDRIRNVDCQTKRRRISTTHRVRSVGHRIPERQRQKLCRDRADRHEATVALNRKRIRNGCGDTSIRSNSRQRDLDALKISTRL